MAARTVTGDVKRTEELVLGAMPRRRCMGCARSRSRCARAGAGRGAETIGASDHAMLARSGAEAQAARAEALRADPEDARTRGEAAGLLKRKTGKYERSLARTSRDGQDAAGARGGGRIGGALLQHQCP